MYWNWDPRQTSIFILLIIYGAYFLLRSAVEDEERRARMASVYSILAFISVPFLVFIIPRIYMSLHPDPLINVEGQLASLMYLLIDYLLKKKTQVHFRYSVNPVC